ncbi:MAG TPA: hypothetical protein VLF59_04385 [Candidatus Saccharimonadales bacterium]|nr:hypothetical protein [Candidatus Saccharimonadales bacterium]
MSTVLRLLNRAWRPALVVTSLAVIAYVLYFHQLGGLLPGYAPAEVATYHSAESWHYIASNPINAPYKLVLWAAITLGHHHYNATRFVAALCGILAVIVFFFITKAWYGFRIGFLGSLMFATSAGFLHVARLGTPQILQMGILVLIGMTVWHRRNTRLRPWLTYLVAIVFALLLYAPGMVWFELLVVIVLYRRILSHWNKTAVLHRILWLSVTLAILAPLGMGVVTQSQLGMQLLGLPPHLSTLVHLPRNLLDTILGIGVHSNGSALLWLGHVPLLDVVELILAFLGTYYYVYPERTLRSLLLAGSGLIGVLLASLGGPVGIACIIPIAYLLVAGGLNHFVSEWLTVFPRNPIAKSAGFAVIGLLLIFSITFQMRAYFIAWPHHALTRQLFGVPPQ